MKSYWRNFNDREGELDMRCAASATAAARVRCVEARDGRLRRLRPCPSRRPAAVEMVFRKKMEIHMPKLGTDRHKGAPLHRDALTQIDDVERDCS